MTILKVVFYSLVEKIPRGRPQVTFENSSIRTKDRIAEKRSKEVTTEEAVAVVVKKMKYENNFNGVKILEKIVNKVEADKLALKIKIPDPQRMTASAAINLIVTRHFSINDYLHLRKSALKSQHDIYPSREEVSFFFFF